MKASISIIALIIFSAVFTKNYIVTGLSLSDLLLVASTTLIILVHMVQRKKLVIASNAIYLLLLWIVAVAGFFLQTIFISPQINAIEFVKSFIKLSVYLTCYVFIYSYVLHTGKTVTGKVLLSIMLFNALIALYIYAVIISDIDLPYQFLWTGQVGTEYTTYYGGYGYLRARGLFSEPASYGIFQSLGLAYLLFSPGNVYRLKDWRLLVVLLTILLSLSLSALFLTSVILAIYAYSRSGLSAKFDVKPVLFAGGLIIIIALLFTATPLGLFMEENVLSRIESVIHGYDRSATTRLVGAWELSFSALSASPVLGSGLGNLDVLAQKGPALEHADKTGRIHNIYAYILGSLGPPGFFLLVLMTYSIIKKNEQKGVILATSFFSYGGFLDPLFWVFLCIYNLPHREGELS